MGFGSIFSGLSKVGQALQAASQLASASKPHPTKPFRVVVEIGVLATGKRILSRTIKDLKKKLDSTGGAAVVAQLVGVGADIAVTGVDVHVEDANESQATEADDTDTAEESGSDAPADAERPA